MSKISKYFKKVILLSIAIVIVIDRNKEEENDRDIGKIKLIFGSKPSHKTLKKNLRMILPEKVYQCYFCRKFKWVFLVY